MRPQTIGIAVLGWLVTLASSAPAQAHRPADTPEDRALQFLIDLFARDPDDAMRTLRPAPIDADSRRRVLASLPPAGALTPTSGEASKLRGLEAVLTYHERHGVLDTTVIDVPQAFVGIVDRSVLLISRQALRLVSAAELQALVAHEIGHEYFWEGYARALREGDAGAFTEIELKCDGLAALTLMALHLDPGALASAARKLTRFNEGLGAVANAGLYPSLGDRARFVRDVAALRSGRQTRR